MKGLREKGRGFKGRVEMDVLESCRRRQRYDLVVD